MADLPLGNVPTFTLSDTSNIIFANGEDVRKESYADVKADMLGSGELFTKQQKLKASTNEIVQDLLDTGGYGVISGGIVSAQATPNMTVQVTECPLRTSTGARQDAAAISSLPVTAADTTNPRVDIIYVDTTGNTQYLQGTPAASPVAPNIPTGGTLLYKINVPAGATSIINSNIVDCRKILISTDWLNAQLSENTQQIALRPLMSKTNIIYYVNTTTGSDTNDGFTTGTAFKTIQHAIDSLPQVLDHEIIINVSAGAYSEDILIAGFLGKGSLSLKGDTVVSSTRIIKSVMVKSCGCYVDISGFATNTTASNDMNIDSCAKVYLSYMNCIVSNNSNYGLSVNSSFIYITNSVISSKSVAIVASINGRIFSLTNSGSGNTTGMYASYNGEIGYYGIQPSGTTAQLTASGGVIRA